MLYVAHKSNNSMHYDLGERVCFSCYLHERILSAKIRKRIGRSPIIRELYTQDTGINYVSVTFKEIALLGGLTAYCLQTRRKYCGILCVGDENFYLFQ